MTVTSDFRCVDEAYQNYMRQEQKNGREQEQGWNQVQHEAKCRRATGRRKLAYMAARESVGKLWPLNGGDDDRRMVVDDASEQQ